MKPRDRLRIVLDGGIPDRVPHLELNFLIPEQAFGISWPTLEEMQRATPAQREALLERHLDICERVIERYNWCGMRLPHDLHGFFEGEVIPRGVRRFGDRVVVWSPNGMGTYWMPTGANMMEFTELLYMRPDEAHTLARVKRDASIELARRQIDEGVEFIMINSDYAYNQGPFISPAMFAEFVAPYLADIVAKIHEFGARAILHSDGDMRMILDQVVAAGIDGYQSIDPQGHMDIAEVKRQYGDRLVLMGNVQSSHLQDANEGLIRESVRYCMSHGKSGGRYIFSSSNVIFPGMPLASYHIMLDEYEKLAAY